MKADLKPKAIILRRQGLSYSEILNKIPVAKSTLSLWLRAVGLSKKQKQILSAKKLAAAKRGGETRRKERIRITEEIKDQARKEVKKMSKQELWSMGIMLYWAEGSKEKDGGNSQIIFSNSDPFMIKLFITWLKVCLKIPDERISYQIYVHENSKRNDDGVLKYWQKVTGASSQKFGKIYYKKHPIKSKRKNQSLDYYGLLRVGVKKSANLNRKIAGWIEGICVKWGVV